MSLFHKKQKKSIQMIVLSYTILLIIMQTIFCTFIIFCSDITEKLDDSNHLTFSNVASYKVSSLENQLFSYADAISYYRQISDEVNNFLKDNNVSMDTFLSSELLQNQLLQKASPIVLDSLRNSPANSCFMILDNGNTDAYKNCLYFRDLDPLNNAKDHSDVILKYGSSSLIYEYDFTMDSSWSPKINTDRNFLYFNLLMQSAVDNPNLSPFELEFISPVFRIHSQDEPCIAYCIPLIDTNHQPYGVLGFDITVSYLKTFLNHHEISIDNNGCFMIAKKVSDKTIIPLLIENTEHYPTIQENKPLHCRICLPNYDIYEIRQVFHPNKISMCMKPISIYRENSLYAEDEYVLCVIAHNNLLFHSSYLVNQIIFFYFVAIIAIIIICTILLSRKLKLSICSFMKDVSNLSPGYTKLKRTNISEFDELADAIEKQNIELYQSTLKIADIFDSSDIKIAILEIPNDKQEILCNHKLFDILCMDASNWQANQIQKDDLFPRLRARSQCFIKSHECDDDYLYRTPELTDKWINIKHIVNATSQTYIFREITDEILSREQLMHERDFDDLTNLYNRRAFAREMTFLLDGKHCTNGVLSIWDLDNLKYTNDTYGHDMGDKYICLLAETLKTDLNVPSVCARLAGDEFTLFLYGANNAELKEKLNQLHILAMNQYLLLPDGKKLSMSVSAGMSCYTEDAPTYQELLRYADFAMYQIKKSSKGRIKAYDKESYIKNHILVQGQGELERIISEKAIRFFFQPICSMDTNRVIGYEALMRPISDLLGRPDNLIRVAAAQSKLGQIERITWFHALNAFINQKTPDDSAKLFLNSIPNQILSDADFEELEILFKDHLSCIVLEITEETESDSNIEEKKRDFCKKWNIAIALDDYGSGYSNNDILFTRDFQYIKLDMKLVRNIHQSSSMQSLVQSIIQYCHENKQYVIAEGIESKEEYDLLKKLGADYGQGFYFGKPSPSLYH